ncbi:class I SAM-dependent methyltransferase [Paenibacillus koleovorans]|uniref:class I SAM-dependent methyltransferase n=1 Tax=Paenibacillus koleovorans TaxID=121608 RepID=UPI000FD7A63F|nr:class I SAM-dependent methyltransferase [Paenibacillus koleovorans]
MNEIDQIKQRYSERNSLKKNNLYNSLIPSVYMSLQEKERALIRWIKDCKVEPIEIKTVLEVGCGGGGNLLQLIQLGFLPENLTGNELQEDRALAARKKLPQDTAIIVGDASENDFGGQLFDIVYVSTVFSSILDDSFQQKLAGRIWEKTKPGGGVLWYDFIYDNPSNRDVKGIPVRRIKELFPLGEIREWSLTLAPPISRRVTKFHPSMYTIFNCISLLRTHKLCWIEKKK